MEILAKLCYTYLFVLVMVTARLCVKVGLRADREGKALSPVLNALHLLIFGLAFVQSYQVFSLIVSPIGPTWWIPLICKQASLYAYIIILKFIEWRMDDSCGTTSNECTCDSYL